MTYTEVNAHSLRADNGNRVRTKKHISEISGPNAAFYLYFLNHRFSFLNLSFKMVFMVFIGILSGMKQRIPKVSVGFCLLNSVLVKSQ